MPSRLKAVPCVSCTSCTSLSGANQLRCFPEASNGAWLWDLIQGGSGNCPAALIGAAALPPD